MRAAPIKVREAVEKYVERELSRKREIDKYELTDYIELECGIKIIDDELLSELTKQAIKNIGFVYIKIEEE